MYVVTSIENNNKSVNKLYEQRCPGRHPRTFRCAYAYSIMVDIHQELVHIHIYTHIFGHRRGTSTHYAHIWYDKVFHTAVTITEFGILNTFGEILVMNTDLPCSLLSGETIIEHE